MTSLANDPGRPRPTRSPLALIAESADGPTRGLGSMLESEGYRVLIVSTGREVLDRALSALPDLILVDASLPDFDGVEVCRALRQDPAIARPTPIVLITSAPVAQRLRLAALRAGAWDCLGLPLDTEELLLKLETFMHVKLEADRVREEGSIEDTSGLYTARGLERRARELVADAFRRHAALACVALAAEPEFPDTRTAQAAAARVAALPKPAGVPPLQVRAGYEAVQNVRDTPLEPASLLQHATAALRSARAGVDGKQFRRYESGAG